MLAGLVNIPPTAGGFWPFILPRCFAESAAMAYFKKSLLIARMGAYTAKNFEESDRSNLAMESY